MVRHRRHRILPLALALALSSTGPTTAAALEDDAPDAAADPAADEAPDAELDADGTTARNNDVNDVNDVNGGDPDAAEDASTAVDGSTEPGWTLDLSAEAGIGTRGFDLPQDGVIYHFRSGLFPTFGLGFALDHWLSRVDRVGMSVRYRSSVGLDLLEQRTDGSEQSQSARSAHLEVGIAPTIGLDSDGGWAISGSLGYSLLDMRPLGHLLTPAFHLAGPFARVTLQVPVGGELIRLRIGPEAQWIAQVGRDLRERDVASSGFGVGAEAAVDVRLGRWTVSATYREWHAFLESDGANGYADVARFATARLAGQL